VATAPPLAAGAPLAGAALEPLLLHAANARTLTAASAPILCSFIQYSSKSPVESTLLSTRDEDRSRTPGARSPVALAAPSEGRACRALVRDGWWL
jgi:hypothetical protein